MEFEWDKQKAESNWQKHRVRFRDAVTVLRLDEMAITTLDEHPDEERYVTIGMSAIGQLLVVVYTYRDKTMRIISARKATKTETAIYLEETS
ncbi:MAG: BrnT family toxin [Crocosphaera sp.]|nr:BrnT family toxin [Crocosphaera sp.]